MFKLPRLAIIIPLLLYCSMTSATIIDVPADYTSIQAGIDASSDDDTVLVQPGTYDENINFNGHNIVLGSLFLTTEDTSYISQTIIDGDSLGSVVIFENSEDSTTAIIGFTIYNGLAERGAGIKCVNNAMCRIADNHIINNMPLLSSWQNHGSGIYCYYSSPAILNNIIINNGVNEDLEDFYLTGGAIYCEYSFSLIQGNVILNNSAKSGSAIYSDKSSTRIYENTIQSNNSDGSAVSLLFADSLEFINNEVSLNLSSGIGCETHNGMLIKANYIYGNHGCGVSSFNSSPSLVIDGNIILENISRSGAGISIAYGWPVISNNLIKRNNAYLYMGGGIFLYRANGVDINNNIITENRSPQGGGIFLEVSSPIMTNNTITNNFAEEGGAIYLQHSSPTMTNSICWNDSAGDAPEVLVWGVYSDPVITYCDIQGGFEGEGNIDCDPMFCNPDSGDYHIDGYSCCGGAGENGVNIGAQGIGCSYFYIAGDANMAVIQWPPQADISDVTYLVEYFRGINQPCRINGFYSAADVNGDCQVIGSDVTRLVSYFRGISTLNYCPDYPPAWLTPEDCPETMPSGWPGCE
jgi:predicted outer membrane repeat protein